jgi:phosphoribosylglycinamide formyltransferase-1
MSIAQKITFLSSGNGGNLKFLYSLSKLLPMPNVELGVIADRECGATLFAKRNGLRCKIIEVTRSNQLDLSLSITEFNPDLIFTTIHKIISPSVLDLFGERMMNLHYSLLPSYKGVIGMKGVQSAIANHDLFLGVTTHKVTAELDGGPILLQSSFHNPLDFELAAQASFRIGCLQIWSLLQGKMEGALPLTDNNPDLIKGIDVIHSRAISPLPSVVDEAFWSQLSTL